MSILKSGISVVIPAYNEESTIVDLVKGVSEHIAPSQIIVVDDQSSDRTNIFAFKTGCHVIRTSGPRGYGSAVSTGIKYAAQLNNHTFVTIDGDAAHNPNDIPRIYQNHVEAKNNLTIGNRFAIEDHNIPSPKRWANLVGANIGNKILNVTLQDVACGLRVISSKLSHALALAAVGIGFEHVYDTIAVAAAARMKIGTVPIGVRYDATELHCTSAIEITHFVHSMLRWASVENKTVLQNMLDAVSNFEPMTLLFDECIICSIPVPGTASYIFKKQHPAFSGKYIGVELFFRTST